MSRWRLFCVPIAFVLGVSWAQSQESQQSLGDVARQSRQARKSPEPKSGRVLTNEDLAARPPEQPGPEPTPEPCSQSGSVPCGAVESLPQPTPTPDPSPTPIPAPTALPKPATLSKPKPVAPAVKKKQVPEPATGNSAPAPTSAKNAMPANELVVPAGTEITVNLAGRTVAGNVKVGVQTVIRAEAPVALQKVPVCSLQPTTPNGAIGIVVVARCFDGWTLTSITVGSKTYDVQTEAALPEKSFSSNTAVFHTLTPLRIAR